MIVLNLSLAGRATVNLLSKIFLFLLYNRIKHGLLPVSLVTLHQLKVLFLYEIGHRRGGVCLMTGCALGHFFRLSDVTVSQ